MQRYLGSCHCQAIKVVFETKLMTDQLALRECGCSFCRLHGARTTTDPEGRLTITGQPARYRFGLATAEFLLCPTCGVYVAALLTVEGQSFATLNVNLLEANLTQPAQAVSYGEETAQERIARRRARWTPADLLDELAE